MLEVELRQAASTTDRAERTTHRSTSPSYGPSYGPPSGPGLVVPIVNSGNERYGVILWNRRTGCPTICSLVVLPLGVWSGEGATRQSGPTPSVGRLGLKEAKHNDDESENRPLL